MIHGIKDLKEKHGKLTPYISTPRETQIGWTSINSKNLHTSILKSSLMPSKVSNKEVYKKDKGKERGQEDVGGNTYTTI